MERVPQKYSNSLNYIIRSASMKMKDRRSRHPIMPLFELRNYKKTPRKMLSMNFDIWGNSPFFYIFYRCSVSRKYPQLCSMFGPPSTPFCLLLNKCWMITLPSLCPNHMFLSFLLNLELSSISFRVIRDHLQLTILVMCKFLSSKGLMQLGVTW